MLLSVICYMRCMKTIPSVGFPASILSYGGFTMYEGFDLTRYVPVMSVTFLAFTCFLAFMVPILAIYWFRKKFHGSFTSLFYGAADYLTIEFMICEITWVGLFMIPVFQNSTLAYIIVSLIAAALIYEGGRYLLMHMLVTKQQLTFRSVFLFAAGIFTVHSFLNVLVSSFETFVVAMTINDTGLEALVAEAGENAATLLTTIEPMLESSAFIYLVPGLHLFVTLLFHVSASVLAYAICRGRLPKYYLPVIMALRFLYEIPGYLVSYGILLTNSYVAELICIAAAAALAYLAYRTARTKLTDDLASLTEAENKNTPFPKFNANIKKGSITKNANLLSGKKEE